MGSGFVFVIDDTHSGCISADHQYGSSRHTEPRSIAVPWTNFENLGTSRRQPERRSSSTQLGIAAPLASCSFTSNTACGKRVSCDADESGADRFHS